MSSDKFDWSDARKTGEEIVPEQAAIAVYENDDGDLVIRQKSEYGEDDHYICIQYTYLPRLITALEQARLKGRRDPEDG